MMTDTPQHQEEGTDECNASLHLSTEDAALLLQVGRSLSSVVRTALRSLRLTPELWLLMEVMPGKPKRLTELAVLVGGAKGSVSRWIATLEKLGLVDDHAPNCDRREKWICLSAFGVEQLQVARGRIAAALRCLSLPIGEAKHVNLSTLRQQIAEKVQ